VRKELVGQKVTIKVDFHLAPLPTVNKPLEVKL
jgi:hypothetical protein